MVSAKVEDATLNMWISHHKSYMNKKMLFAPTKTIRSNELEKLRLTLTYAAQNIIQ
ncbi:hypothetical protein G9A89_017591 [Geosiphon pyriformis]|nr:hypothetical protein G9A89_017591 [Geosiphon pyriformis]